MNQKKIYKRKKIQNHFKLGCIIIIVSLPILYSIYLYSQQNIVEIHVLASKLPTRQIPDAQKLEIPITVSPRKEQIIRHSGYIVSYNDELRLPNWVAYELTRQETQGKQKRNNHFISDPVIKGIIATNADYLHSGYDKGHMAPAADMKWSSTAMKESFYFSNICPQHPDLNRGIWKVLEEKIRNWAITDSAIIIVAGPIIEKRAPKIGKNRITVPQYFFKVILSPFTTSPKAIGFLFKNERSTQSLKNHTLTVDSIEILTGLDFFSALPDDVEEFVESRSTDYFPE